MDQQNVSPAQSNANTSQKLSGLPPEGLPVLENKKIITHTMKDDLAQAQSRGNTVTTGDEIPPAQKPFSASIPPPPMPPMPEKTSLNQDAFREPIENLPIGRDQDIPLPGMPDQSQAHEQFKIQIPQRKKSVNATTIILTVILAVLIAGGGFGYYWFFIKESDTTTPTNQEPTPPAPEPQPIIPTPKPIKPDPIPPTPPAPIATSTKQVATSTTPIIATSTPPIIEPALPQTIINADQTIVLELSATTTPPNSGAELIKQIKEKNAKITAYKSIIRYPIKLLSAKEKRFANNQETAQFMGLAIPADFWKNTDNLELIGYKSGSVFRYGFASKTLNKEALKQAAEKWQATMLDDLKPLYIEKSYAKPTTITFLENAYLDFYKRYVNMPSPDVSLDYAISDKYFVTATSKEMIYAVLSKANTSSSIASAEKLKTLGPKESYLVMKKDSDNIKSFADLEKYTVKYGSRRQIEKLEANKKQADTLPQSFKEQLVALTQDKIPSSSEITSIQETINGNTATLNIQSTKSGLTGVVTLVLEDGQWKLDLESWEQK